MDSGYYLNKKNRYEEIRDYLQSSMHYFDDALDRLNTTGVFFEEQIISGEQLDNGEIGESIADVNQARQDIETLVSECDTKIAENDELYRQALAQETETAAEEEKRADV